MATVTDGAVGATRGRGPRLRQPAAAKALGWTAGGVTLPCRASMAASMVVAGRLVRAMGVAGDPAGRRPVAAHHRICGVVVTEASAVVSRGQPCGLSVKTEVEKAPVAREDLYSHVHRICLLTRLLPSPCPPQTNPGMTPVDSAQMITAGGTMMKRTPMIAHTSTTRPFLAAHAS